MAAQIKLYTTGNMEKAKIINSPSYNSGHPADYLLDNNLDTYWEITSGATDTVNIDLGEALQVDCFILFVKNYKSLSTGGVDRYWSDNGSTWNFISGGPSLVDTSTPLRININGLGLTHRYWRFSLTGTYGTAQIAAVWWGRLFTISQGNEYPELESDQFYNLTADLSGGRLAIKGINRNRSRRFERTWLISGTSNLDALRNAFNDSAGRRYPLIINEGSQQSDAAVVRFAEDNLTINQIDYQVYNPTVSFVEIPYIDDGDSY
jgi:hypothetical protein